MTKSLLYSQRKTLYEITGVRFGTSEEEYRWGKEILEDKSAALVFADLLEERGDNRGKLIRVEAELRNLGYDPNRELKVWSGSLGPYCGYEMEDGSQRYIAKGEDAVQVQILELHRTALRRELGYDEPQRVPVIGGPGDGAVVREPLRCTEYSYGGRLYMLRQIPDALGTPRACYVWEGWTGRDAELTRRVSEFYLERCEVCGGQLGPIGRALELHAGVCPDCHGTGWLEKGDYE